MNTEDQTIAVWLLRFLLATLLLFAGEVLLWMNLLARQPADWPVMLAGYVALAALLLDLAARYRIRDFFDAMTLAAIFSLSAGLLINPAFALEEFPRTLLTRVLGGYAAPGLLMFGLFLALTGGAARLRLGVLAGTGLMGLLWGIRMRWTPELTGLFTQEIDLAVLVIAPALFLTGALLLARIAARRGAGLSPAAARLSLRGWSLLVVALLALFLLHVAREHIDEVALGVSLVILAQCWAVLWLRRPRRGSMLLAAHIPPAAPSWTWGGAMVMAFAGSVAVGYWLPLIEIDGWSLLALIEGGFTAVGFLWLPVIAVRIGARAIERQMRMYLR
jgi:hypothetical protein